MSEVAVRTAAHTPAETAVSGVVTTSGPDMSELQVTNRRNVRRAHLAIVEAESKGDKVAVAKAKGELRKALTEGRALVRADILDVEDKATKARTELAEMDATVKTYKAHTLATVGLAGFHLGAAEIMADLFGFTGKTETTEGQALHKRVSRLMTRGISLAIAREAKGATLTKAEEAAIAKAAPTSVKAAREQTYTAETVAALAPAETVEVSPAEVAVKALDKAVSAIGRAEDAVKALQSVLSDVPSDKAETVATILAKIDALRSVWTTPPAAPVEGPTDAELDAIESGDDVEQTA